MNKEKADAARRMFWPRMAGYWILFFVSGCLFGNVFLDLIGRHSNNVAVPATWLASFFSLLLATRAVKRAGLSQTRTVRYLLTSPRPNIDLPASELRSDRDVWRGLALFCGFFGLLILSLVHFLGGIHVEYGYGTGIFFVLFSLFFGWLWKKNGYLVCRVDEQGITLPKLKERKVILWEDIAFCEGETTYNLFGQKALERLHFLNKGQQTIGSVSLQDASAKQRTLFLNQLECWFGERSQSDLQSTVTAKEPTPTRQPITEPLSDNVKQVIGGR